MFKRLLLVLSVIVIAVTLIFPGCSKTEQTTPAAATKTLKIGVIYGLTGDGSQIQLTMRDATVLCADWINSNGGITIKGEKYKIELDIADNQMTPPGSVQAATKLIDQDKIQFIVGTMIPAQADAVAPIAEKARVLFVSQQSDMPHADQAYYFVGNYSYGAPAAQLYQILKKDYPAAKSVAYLIGDESGARNVEQVGRQVATAMGFTLLDTTIYPWNTTDFYSLWPKIIAEKPDVVDIGLSLPATTAAAVKQGRELGYTGVIICSTPGNPSQMLDLMGAQAATDFIHITFDPYDPAVPTSDTIKTMVKLWEAKFNKKFDLDALKPWDAFWVTVQAIEKAQSTDPSVVKDTFATMESFNTALGPAKLGGQTTFGSNHMVFNPIPISRWMNGKLEFLGYFDSYIP